MTKAEAKEERLRAEAVQIKKYWDEVDADNSGVLDRGEVSDLLRLMVDKDDDGVDMKEFTAWWQNKDMSSELARQVMIISSQLSIVSSHLVVIVTAAQGKGQGHHRPARQTRQRAPRHVDPRRRADQDSLSPGLALRPQHSLAVGDHPVITNYG
jgi:hypothetical protein